MPEQIYSQIFQPGEDIIRIGDAGRNAYFIEYGGVEVSIPTKGGVQVLAKMAKGEIFGEMSIIDDAPRSATVTATVETEVIVIELARHLQSLELENPMMNLILRVVLSRFRQASTQINDDNSSIYKEDTSINEIRALAFEKMQFERKMRKGLDKGEFELHYQPIVELQSGNIMGFEALMRWRHGNNYVSPVEFIPISEETGLIIEQGRFALELGLKDHQRFSELLENSSSFISINLSGLQISNFDEIDRLGLLIKDSNLNPDQIKLEVTETLMLADFSHAVEALKRLKKLGISIAIDDFGTGYSSLSYLHQLPLDTLKIDRAFINDMNKTEKSMRVVESITGLALALGMNIVAEGIEEKEQFELLKQLGCQYGQGYYMSRPLPAIEIEKLLISRPSW